jgi:Tfp pilus assembly protein PilX
MRIRLHRRASQPKQPNQPNEPDEQGMAMATSMMIMMLCTIVVATILGLATHSAQRSGLSRDRTAALNAAQAGIQSELSLISDGSCPTTAVAETALPNQTLPTASYIIQAPPAATCTVNGPAVIVATGYVPNATRPITTTTMVAHINRTQGAPVSTGTNGGYDFPDVAFTDGSLSATAGALNLFGTGGAVPNVTANTGISIGTSANNGSQLGGGLYGQGPVVVYASQIGGPVTGTTVSLTGQTASTSGLTVQGSVGASGTLALKNTTVNGSITSGGAYTNQGFVTITGSTTSGGPTLPLARPLGAFDNSDPADIGTTLGVGAATNACPASATAWTSSFYDLTTTCAVGYSPGTFTTPATNGNMVIVVRGAFTVNLPQTAVGGQLYIIDAGSAGSDSLTITGGGSTLPVFAFTDGTLNLSGNLVGQVAAHSINVTGATTLTFAPPATPMPDIAFPIGYSAPNLGGVYYSRVAFEYQCAGATAC